MNETQQYSATEMERMMKVQDVLLKAMAKKITWWAAAEIIGVTDRTMRRVAGADGSGGLRGTGRPEQVRGHVLRLAETFGVDRGGAWFYVEIDAGFPFENVRALIAAIASLRGTGEPDNRNEVKHESQ